MEEAVGLYVRELMMCHDQVQETMETTFYIDELMTIPPYIYRSWFVRGSVEDVH